MNPEPEGAPPPAEPRAASVRLPAKACDTHLHVFGDPIAYPLWPGRGYTPHPCSLAQYRELMLALGVDRAVLVQPSVYGTDNRALLDALAAGGPAFRGVVVPSPLVDDETLGRMDDLGVKGFRLNLVNPAVLSVDEAVAFARRVADRGWHMVLQIDLARDGIAPLQAMADRVALPMVIDHFGFPGPRGIPHELLSMLEQSRCWIKLSGAYRLGVGMVALKSMVRTLAAANPERLLWGSDWPHTDMRVTVQAAEWVDLLFDWLQQPALREQVFAANPARLYGFADD
jgi:predicted TIM-barrel fold metal-dependent hydrolase